MSNNKFNEILAAIGQLREDISDQISQFRAENKITHQTFLGMLNGH